MRFLCALRLFVVFFLFLICLFSIIYVPSPLSSSSCWSSPPSSSSSLARRLRCEPHALRSNQTLRPNAAGALYQLLCEASALSAGKYRFTDLHACCLCARQKRATVLQAEHTRWLRPERALSTVPSLLKGGSNWLVLPLTVIGTQLIYYVVQFECLLVLRKQLFTR